MIFARLAIDISFLCLADVWKTIRPGKRRKYSWATPDFFMGREFGVAEIFLSPHGDEKADLLGGGIAPVRDAMDHSGGGGDGVAGPANCPLSS
jgi:hypothetical protein